MNRHTFNPLACIIRTFAPVREGLATPALDRLNSIRDWIERTHRLLYPEDHHLFAQAWPAVEQGIFQGWTQEACYTLRYGTIQSSN